MQLDSTAFLADSQLIEELGKQSTSLACDRDRILFRQGDAPLGVYILLKGEATLTMTAQSGETILSTQAVANSLLGLPGLIGNQPYTLTAVAHIGAQLNFVSRDEFTALMQSRPQLSLKILQVIAAELRSARHALLEG